MIDAKHKNFLATVDLIQAKESIDYAIQRLESGDETMAVANMRLSICRLADAIEATYRVK